MYQIITDSCCDFTKQQYQELGLACVPLTVTYKGKSHSNFSDPTAVKAFYDELRSGVTASTSAVNPDGWATLMEDSLKHGKDVLALAYERTCLNTGGLNWPYMNKILARWHEAGLHTLQDVKAGDRKPTVPKGASGELGQAEIEAIARMMREG